MEYHKAYKRFRGNLKRVKSFISSITVILVSMYLHRILINHSQTFTKAGSKMKDTHKRYKEKRAQKGFHKYEERRVFVLLIEITKVNKQADSQMDYQKTSFVRMWIQPFTNENNKMSLVCFCAIDFLLGLISKDKRLGKITTLWYRNFWRLLFLFKVLSFFLSSLKFFFNEN